MISGFLSLQEVKTTLLNTCAETSMKKACLDVKMIGTFTRSITHTIAFVVLSNLYVMIVVYLLLNTDSS